MLEELQNDYIVQARSKGLKENRIVYRHALPNASLPVITLLGFEFSRMLAGAVLVESVFSWPGMGRLLIDSAQVRDYPTLMGILIFSTVFVIAGSLITDILYLIIDPRIRISGRTG